MAEKKNKRPKHTNLVVPGASKKEKKPTGRDRLGRTATDAPPVAGGERAPFSPAPPQPPGAGAGEPQAQTNGAQVAEAVFPQFPQSADDPPKNEADSAQKSGAAPAEETAKSEKPEKPPKLIRLPKRRKRLSAVKRRRRRRRIRLAAIALLAVAAVLVFSSGLHLTAASLLSDHIETLRIAARPADGFPINFAIIGFIRAEPMGEQGFAALGDREVALVSSTGAELRRLQHTYLMPGISAGNTRVAVYSRGGKEYTVESRSKTLLRGETEMDIQFAEMSPDGWLALATSSRYRSELAVYGPTYDMAEPLFLWRESDEKPILARFHPNNKNLLLGCVSARDGALGSTLFVLQTDRAEPLAEVRVDGTQLLMAEYLPGGAILAVFDTFAALFNQRGEEQARFAYNQRRLLNADCAGGNIALVFDAADQEEVYAVLLNSRLEPLFDVAATVGYSTTARVLANANGAFILCGQQVLAYGLDGRQAGVLTPEQKALDLVRGGPPLLFTSGQVQSLEALLLPEAVSASAASVRLQETVSLQQEP